MFTMYMYDVCVFSVLNFDYLFFPEVARIMEEILEVQVLGDEDVVTHGQGITIDINVLHPGRPHHEDIPTIKIESVIPLLNIKQV